MLGSSWLSRGLFAVVLAALAAPVVLLPGGGPEAQAGITPVAAAAARDKGRPDIVFVLMDDFSLELLATMPNAQKMVSEGASYDNAFVVDSLCCPSRASIFTGRAPHQTHVLTNTPNDYAKPIGGFEAFARYGNLGKTFNVRLERHGYTTGFIGKYMNRYEATNSNGTMLAPRPVPGWSEFEAILGGGYNGWGFLSTRLADDGRVRARRAPEAPRTSTARPTRRTPRTSPRTRPSTSSSGTAATAAPYFLEVAVYAPHSRAQRRATPASRCSRPRWPTGHPAGDPAGGNCGLKACSRLTLARPEGVRRPARRQRPDLPATRRSHPSGAAVADQRHPAVRRGGAERSTATGPGWCSRSTGCWPASATPSAPTPTWCSTSDNGFHLGQHLLNGGKGTPYDSDTRVPLVVTGPDVVPGRRSQFVNNIDLAPTFEQLAGLRPSPIRSGTGFAPTPASGRMPVAAGTRSSSTPTPGRQPGEVDLDMGSGGTIDIIPSFIAVRGDAGLLVRLDLDQSWSGTDYAWELYRYDRPWEDVNVFATTTASRGRAT